MGFFWRGISVLVARRGSLVGWTRIGEGETIGEVSLVCSMGFSKASRRHVVASKLVDYSKRIWE
jgi:hypothetical protein